MTGLFWVSLAFVCYTYFGYPLLLRLRARRIATLSDHAGAPLPPVAVIIPAYEDDPGG